MFQTYQIPTLIVPTAEARRRRACKHGRKANGRCRKKPRRGRR